MPAEALKRPLQAAPQSLPLPPPPPAPCRRNAERPLQPRPAPPVSATAGPVPAERRLATTARPNRALLRHRRPRAGGAPIGHYSRPRSARLRHRRPRAGGALIGHYSAPLRPSPPPPAPCRRSAEKATTAGPAPPVSATAGPVPAERRKGHYGRPLAETCAATPDCSHCPPRGPAKMNAPAPIYTSENCRAAYQLNWSLALFWQEPAANADWLADLQRGGARRVPHPRYQFARPGVSQFLVSTRPETAPERLVWSVKGRLQHQVRRQCPKAFHRNYGLRSAGPGHWRGPRRVCSLAG